MKVAFGGLIASILLGLFVYLVVVAITTVAAGNEDAINHFETSNMSDIMSLLGGLVSAIVIAELAVTHPGTAPAARSITTKPDAFSTKVITGLTIGFCLVWLFTGLAAFVTGVLRYENDLKTLTDLGQAWFGLAITATYAYFGINPAPAPGFEGVQADN